MKKRLLCSFLLLALAVSLLAGCGKTNLDKAAEGLTDYEIAARLDTGRMEILAEQKVTYRNRGRVPLTELVFNLYPNGYREDAAFKPVHAESEARAYPHGKSYGHIDVAACRVNGKTAEAEVGGVDRNALTVAVPELYPDEKVTVELSYTVKLANIRHRLGYADNTINLGNWYPVACVYEDGAFRSYPYYANGDPFYSEAANYDVSLTVPAGYTVAASGELTASREQDGLVTNRYRARAARDFALVVSDKFRTAECEADGVKISYYYFADPAPEASLKLAKESVLTFGELFGKYPYPTLAVVETDFVHGGMEYPGLIYIATDVGADAYGEVVVHETAHQWWYGAVGNDEVRYGWLDEGLTEFSTALFYEKNPAYGKGLADFAANARLSYKNYLRLLLSMGLTPDTSMDRAAGEFKTEYEYVTMTYAKGQLLFYDLYRLIGEEKFLKSLARYYSDYCFAVATPASLIGAFEKASARTLEGWFESYLTGRAVL